MSGVSAIQVEAKLRNFKENSFYRLGRLVGWRDFPHYWLPQRHVVAYLKRMESLRSRKVVFVATSGRSGSGHLAKLLNCSPNVKAVHEPRPQILGKLQSHSKFDNPYDRMQLAKVYAINKQLEQLPVNVTYAETSHMFIKTFWAATVDYFQDVRVIRLRRDPAETLHSCLQLGFFTPYNASWRDWMSVPGLDAASLGPIEYGKAYLKYVDALCCRVREATEHKENVNWFDCELSSLNSQDGLNRLSEFLDLPRAISITDVPSEPSNQRPGRKSAFSTNVSLSECRQLFEQ